VSSSPHAAMAPATREKIPRANKVRMKPIPLLREAGRVKRLALWNRFHRLFKP
jgi:hypothetical protein